VPRLPAGLTAGDLARTALALPSELPLFSAFDDGERIFLDAHGAESGLIIGKKGATLDALQYVVNRIVSKKPNDGPGVVVDAEGYRGRREDSLVDMANRLAEKAIKTQLVLDALGDDLDIQVGQQDLTERLVVTSRQYGIQPQELLGYLQQQNQLPAMFADVRRGLTIAAAVEAATVKDSDGNVIDTTEFFGKRSPEDGDVEESDDDDDDADAAGDSK